MVSNVDLILSALEMLGTENLALGKGQTPNLHHGNPESISVCLQAINSCCGKDSRHFRVKSKKTSVNNFPPPPPYLRPIPPPLWFSTFCFVFVIYAPPHKRQNSQHDDWGRILNEDEDEDHMHWNSLFIVQTSHTSKFVEQKKSQHLSVLTAFSLNSVFIG